jgi:hypothetical protein
MITAFELLGYIFCMPLIFILAIIWWEACKWVIEDIKKFFKK